MRTLTTAQQREITGPASVKMALDLSDFEYISTPDTGTTYGYFSPMLNVSDYSSEIGWLGGIGTISDLDININNSQLESDYFNSAYLNYEPFTMKLIVNDTSYDLYEGIIEDYTINDDEIKLNGVDNASIYNIDILEQFTPDDSSNTSESQYYPICYFTYGDGKYINPFPMINYNGYYGGIDFIIGNHYTPLLSAGPYIYQYSSAMEEYIRFVDRMSFAIAHEEPSVTEIGSIKGRIGNLAHTPYSYYRNATVGEQNSHTGSLSNIFDKDDANYITLGASEALSIKFELEDLGEIRASNNVSFYIQTSNRSGTVSAQLLNSSGSAAYSSTINADSFQFQNWAGHVFTFSELSSTFELAVVTSAASGCRVYFMELYISEFHFYKVKSYVLGPRA